ncbi:MAG: preprotein translocase subunit SecY [Candidatus Dojkabacteria bacterium]
MKLPRPKLSKSIARKLLVTVAVLVVYRFMATVPIPGVDAQAFQDTFGDTPFTNIYSLISGGRLDKPTIVAIGIAPYINASIIMQLLQTVVPKLEELRKEGESGRNKINQYTRLLTVPLALIQSIMIYTILTNPEITGGAVGNVIQPLTGIELVTFVITLTTGSIILMWLGELITEHGLGNGASLIITFGILATLPSLITSDITGLNADFEQVRAGNLDFLTSNSFLLFYVILAIVVGMTFIIVYGNEAMKKIPILHARRYRGDASSGVENFLPIRLNPAGVIPVIFAQAMLTFPQIISSFILSIREAGRLYDFALDLQNSPIFLFNTWEYVVLFGLMTFGFTYFYTFVIVKPEEIAKNLQKSGAYIPGVRPGTATIDYLNQTTIRLTLFGGTFLAGISVVPIIVSIIEGSGTLTILSGIGGTSLLIIVSVFMDSYRKAQALSSFESYDEFK